MWDMGGLGSRSHRHIKLISTYGAILTEHLLNADGKTSDFQEARKSPYNRAERKNERREVGWDLRPWEGEPWPTDSWEVPHWQEASREEGALPSQSLKELVALPAGGTERSLGCQRGRASFVVQGRTTIGASLSGLGG